MPYSLEDLELEKFRHWNGYTATAVVGPDGNPISFTGTVNAVTSVVYTETAPQILLPANVNRKNFYIYNKSLISTLYIQFGEAASTTFFIFSLGTELAHVADQPCYTGIIYGVWDLTDSNGYTLITELT